MNIGKIGKSIEHFHIFGLLTLQLTQNYRLTRWWKNEAGKGDEIWAWISRHSMTKMYFLAFLVKQDSSAWKRIMFFIWIIQRILKALDRVVEEKNQVSAFEETRFQESWYVRIKKVFGKFWLTSFKCKDTIHSSSTQFSSGHGTYRSTPRCAK